MKKYKPLIKESITKEMEDWFNERTKRHIVLVNKYGNLILNSDIVKQIDVDTFVKESLFHDSSKFQEPEKTPYIYISWDYHCKDLGISFIVPEEIKTQMNVATNRHVTCNRHHPEYWMKNKTLDVINRADRDQPNDAIIDCTNMPLTYIASMCADWMAMSEEKGNTPQGWAKKNVNVRWQFTKEQTDFIYKVLNTIWSN